MLINKIKLSELTTSYGNINIPLLNTFSPETQQYDYIENSLGLSTIDIINTTIDYEKIKIGPIYDSNASKVNALRFNIHFYNGATWDSDTTKLSTIGFTEDDVVNKRKRLAKTFLRLSYYDSKDLKTQNLLGHSTIFVDCDYLYEQYLISGSTFIDLSMSFLIENPKLSSRVKSFEGYNIYLFKDDLSKTTNKSIYMRADFNNAANGRSILFTKRDDILKDNGYTMEELSDMMFFEIICGFNANINQYVWYFKDLIGKTLNTTLIENDIRIKNVLNIELNQAKVI